MMVIPRSTWREVLKSSNFEEGKRYLCCHASCKKPIQKVCCPHCSGTNVSVPDFIHRFVFVWLPYCGWTKSCTA